eukprot:CAMPEP_0194265662 /NCGR_PEP_ID=MMETSP0169-20130528/832_1 /TAXON_ID=218684 /ORGANISM="Corethron pennatum, Strain L29A3" /LENGTH=385 /DNA_ID=CAMNT_0039006177 /DNA_START=88 /DNA_END=1245 /DNA_ORIENTATION=+
MTLSKSRHHGGLSIVVFLFILPTYVSAYSPSVYKTCSLAYSPNVYLSRHPNNTFKIVYDSQYANNDADNPLSSQRPNIPDDLLVARECPCVPNQYCFNADADACARRPGNAFRDDAAECFRMSIGLTFVRNTWPVLMLWYCALLLFLVATQNGKYVRDYLLARCFRRRNNRIVERVVTREMEIRARMRSFILRQARAVQSANGATPSVPLVLRTRKFDAASMNKNGTKAEGDSVDGTGPRSPTSVAASTLPVGHECYDDEDGEVTCTICLGAVEDGDRVGELSCGHHFHAECLREWLRRKNMCPLCQAPDVARPAERRRGSDEGEDESVAPEAAANPLESDGFSPFGFSRRHSLDWQGQGSRTYLLRTRTSGDLELPTWHREPAS